MTIGTLKMPRMGETMEEGKLVNWLVEPGTPFKRGQEILEVETDKTIVEFPALGDGTVVETLVEIGEMVAVGTPIARVDVGEGTDWTDDGASEDGAAAQESPVKEHAGAAPASAEPDRVQDGDEAAETGDRVRATPLARRIARQRGIDLGRVTGSGRRGRIERSDVEGADATEDDASQIAGVTYLEAGPSGGEPIVLLHGFGADCLAWNGVQSRLSLVGRRSISIDLPGHGTTTHDARSPDDLAGPVDAALTALQTGPIHIVAHSMGAIAALRLARKREVKSLTLIAPAGLGHSIDAQFLRGFARAETPGEISHLLERVTDGPHGLSSTMLAKIHGEVARGRLAALADALVGGTGQAISIRAELAAVAERIPVHMILGHRDRILDWREALDVSPRISVHHLPRVGHSPHWEALADVAAIITKVAK